MVPQRPGVAAPLTHRALRSRPVRSKRASVWIRMQRCSYFSSRRSNFRRHSPCGPSSARFSPAPSRLPFRPPPPRSSECVLLRRQPVRRRRSIVLPGPAVHGESRASSGRRTSGRTYGFAITPVESGRHRLCIGRSARRRCRPRRLRPARPQRSARHADRRTPARDAAARSERRLRDQWIGANDMLHESARRASTGAITPADAQANMALAATQHGRADRASARRGRASTSSSATCPTSARRRADKRAVRRARQQLTALCGPVQYHAD